MKVLSILVGDSHSLTSEESAAKDYLDLEGLSFTSVFGLIKKLNSSSLEERLILANFAGVFSDEATPDPIPNSEVKPASGDGSAAVTLWESSTMPAFFYITRLGNQSGFFMPKF